MHVLSLVTNAEARFYKQQVRSLEALDVTVTTLPVPGRRSTQDGDARTLTDYLRFVPQVVGHSRGSYDLVHANYGLTAPAALAQRRLPVVVSLWGSDLMGTFGPVGRAAARFADETIVMTDEMAADLGGDAHVIPHGVDFDTFAPRPQSDARRDLGWDPDRTHVLFPYPASRDVKDYPRARRVVERAADRLDQPVELQQVYGVPHDEMPTYYSAADALLLTSQREGSPNSVKEAMACNCPVVATDVGDVRERLDGVAHSGVARTDDDLVTLLAAVLDADARSDGRDHLRDLSADRVGEQIRDVYEQVLADEADSEEPEYEHVVPLR